MTTEKWTKAPPSHQAQLSRLPGDPTEHDLQPKPDFCDPFVFSALDPANLHTLLHLVPPSTSSLSFTKVKNLSSWN